MWIEPVIHIRLRRLDPPSAPKGLQDNVLSANAAVHKKVPFWGADPQRVHITTLCG